MALKIKKRGYRIVYEPRAVVDHHSAPRRISGMRSRNYEGIYYANYNFAYIIMRHFNMFRRLGYIGYTAILGEGASQGCSTLLTDSQREYCVETTECGGVSVLIECIVLIASENVVSEAAHAGETA